MNGISPWVAAVNEIFHDQDLPVIFNHDFDQYNVKVHAINNALWIAVTCPKGCRVILRAANAPNDHLQLKKVEAGKNGVVINLQASIGHFKVNLRFPEKNKALLRYTTTLKPQEHLVIPFWPRDMVIIDDAKARLHPEGKIHFSQEGTRSGLQYISFDKPKSGSLLYMQNLTALNDYCQATETSLANVVGGQWPESIVGNDHKKLPSFSVTGIKDDREESFKSFKPKEWLTEYIVSGNQDIKITWGRKD